MIWGGVFGIPLSSRDEVYAVIQSVGTWSFSPNQVRFEFISELLGEPLGSGLIFDGTFSVSGAPLFREHLRHRHRGKPDQRSWQPLHPGRVFRPFPLLVGPV